MWMGFGAYQLRNLFKKQENMPEQSEVYSNTNCTKTDQKAQENVNKNEGQDWEEPLSNSRSDHVPLINHLKHTIVTEKIK